MTTQKFCLALDLNDDPALISEYKALHQNIWPEITESIKVPEYLFWTFIVPETGCL